MEKLPDLSRFAATVHIGGVKFGGGDFGWIAGPCAIEDSPSLHRTAEYLARAGVRVMRGGLFKPRTSVHSFQGLGAAGMDAIRAVKRDFGMAFVSEVLDAESLDILLPVADALQIGSRNVLNYSLLKLVGAAGRPVVLKRGFAITVTEWLNAAEYLLVAGAREVLLCERGIRTATEVTRFTLDLGAIAWLKNNFSMPVLADPSHAAGSSALVPALALAARAAGADGLLIESAAQPETSRCDAAQQLDEKSFLELKRRLDRLGGVL